VIPAPGYLTCPTMQDWTPVVLRSSTKAVKPTSKSPHITRSVAAQTAASVEKKDFGTLKTLSAESRQTLIGKRVALKMTQVQLNQRCSFAPNTIRDVENGSLCPSNGQLNLLNRMLGGGLYLG
jgi:ribosome-binding protein aMBF1 (putative translation factor)